MKVTIPKILILYASYGEAHRQVAAALEQSFRDKGVQAVSIDLYAEAHPVLNAVARFLYHQSFSFGSRLYGWSYDLVRDLDQGGELVRSMLSFGIHKLKQIIKEERPDAVVTTFPISAMPELRRRTGLKIPIFTVITDYALHALWVHPLIDQYFVAADELRMELVSRGVSVKRISVSGIPLRQSFQKQHKDRRQLDSNRLDNKTDNILVMAGGYGSIPQMKEIASNLLGLQGVQILLVCGRNQKMRRELEQTFGQAPNMSVLGFVDRIADLMAASSCIVTKAGGLTLTEAIASELPIVIYRPVPGQEDDNAKYLERKRAALVVRHGGDLQREIQELLASQEKRDFMRRSLRALQKSSSTFTITEQVLESIQTLQGWRQGRAAESNGSLPKLYIPGHTL